jgi:DNA (cytosine-5)-methyltransferase 1
MVTGDITDKNVFNEILKKSKGQIDFLLATPPCQGVSIAGKNRTLNKMLQDERNFLIYKVIEFIHIKKPNYILIENVPMFLKLYLPYKGELSTVEQILNQEFSNEYNIDIRILNTADFGTPQSRKRAVIKIYKKNLHWRWPKQSAHITVKEAIGHLPSLESGETSHINWHFARKHTQKHIDWLKNTPTGKSAFENEIHFPKKENGNRIKGYLSCYRRINWDKPSPSITMRNDAISSQRNVHPGKKMTNGQYSDARVLSLLELMLLTSLPPDWEIPKDTKEVLIRQCLGECVPPNLIKNISKHIGER